MRYLKVIFSLFLHLNLAKSNDNFLFPPSNNNGNISPNLESNGDCLTCVLILSFVQQNAAHQEISGSESIDLICRMILSQLAVNGHESIVRTACAAIKQSFKDLDNLIDENGQVAADFNPDDICEAMTEDCYSRETPEDEYLMCRLYQKGYFGGQDVSRTKKELKNSKSKYGKLKFGMTFSQLKNSIYNLIKTNSLISDLPDIDPNQIKDDAGDSIPVIDSDNDRYVVKDQKSNRGNHYHRVQNCIFIVKSAHVDLSAVPEWWFCVH